MNTGDVEGWPRLSYYFLHMRRERQFDDPTALPKSVLLQDFMKSSFGSGECGQASRPCQKNRSTAYLSATVDFGRSEDVEQCGPTRLRKGPWPL